jgi:hypothetical protein
MTQQEAFELADRQVWQEIYSDAAKKLSQSIDQEIIWSMLEADGWKRFEISRFQDNNHAVDITHWLDENCKGNYHRNGAKFLFEDSKDAALFALRWA